MKPIQLVLGVLCIAGALCFDAGWGRGARAQNGDGTLDALLAQAADGSLDAPLAQATDGSLDAPLAQAVDSEASTSDTSVSADTMAADSAAIAPAIPPPVPQELRRTFGAHDLPDDGGGAIELTWDPASASPEMVLNLQRGPSANGPFKSIAEVAAGDGAFLDTTVVNGTPYFYRIADGEIPPVVAEAKAQWFNSKRFTLFCILLLFLGLIAVYLQLALRGKGLFVRRIAGLDAIEEAVGRATEMGKPVLYVPGIDDANNIQTIYSMVILNSVSKMVARYDTELIVPICKAFVVPLAEETVRAGYLDQGRPDGFRSDNIRFLSDEQFAFTAAVNGIMLRERPAANIFLGSFFAESLMLAETGFTTGAIQIAGTANIHQLPFFVVACDYTMIGEEFFATSAYLSREPMLIGTLKASDAMKVAIMIVLILGAILATAGNTTLNNLLIVQ